MALGLQQAAAASQMESTGDSTRMITVQGRGEENTGAEEEWQREGCSLEKF